MPDGTEIKLPVIEGSIGPKVIDGRELHAKTGYYSYDPGFTSTASCLSAITYIDGDIGQLWYRGYDIADLAEHCSYLETCFLLLYGDLPSKSQLQ